MKKSSDKFVALFVFVLCFVCAALLSVVSLVLKKPQEDAEELYNVRQLLIAADIPIPKGRDETLTYFKNHVTPMVTDKMGSSYTFEEVGLNYDAYVTENFRSGYAHLKYKLYYEIYDEGKVYGYVIPVNGFGLWDAIYGYICVAPNGNRVIGTSWYDQKETPGLGGEIATAEWQKQFHGKEIFRPGESKEVSPIGIETVKGSAKGKVNAVDGIPGATITSNGVTEAYRQSLAPYRNFLIGGAGG